MAYFFHLTEGSRITRDMDGTDLPTLGAAQQAALEAIGQLVAEAVSKGDRDYQGSIQIDDNQGEKVLTLSFSCPVSIGDAESRTDGCISEIAADG